MNGPLLEPAETDAEDRFRGGCTVAGCACKDTRIVLRRRTAFFAAMARRNGQAADRVIPVEAGWEIPQLNPLRS